MWASIPSSVDVGDDTAIMALVGANPACKLEVSADGHILVSPLTGTQTGPKELEAAVQLYDYAKRVGGKAFSSQAGFRLPDSSIVGPDASWVAGDRLAAATAATADATRTAFWRLCPDVAIEVRSENDSWKTLCRKIVRYLENGASYAVAVDCDARRVFERGDQPAGLRLDFERIFDA